MTTASINNRVTARSMPIDIFKQLVNSHLDGCLKVFQGKVTYTIYWYQGKLSYATHTIEPFERLERHLRRLSHQNSKITSAVRTQARLNFEQETDNNSIELPPEYQAVRWLEEQQYVEPTETKRLLELLSKEVFESYLLLKDFQYEFISNNLLKLEYFDYNTFLEDCLEKLQGWQSLLPQITSPYQRPYYDNKSGSNSTAVEQKLRKILIGFSFRQMAVLLNQDDLKLAQNLHSLIIKGTIKLRDPQSPFEQLPKIREINLSTVKITVKSTIKEVKEKELGGIDSINPINSLSEKKLKIACVDDSPTILQEINRFLEGQNLEVFSLNDSVKALIEIMRIKPDLILLDVGMPTVDGYKLCRMIRNSSMFKTTPIIMVTGNNTVVDRAKAKVSGATDYMTKPFTQDELIKMVFRYLT